MGNTCGCGDDKKTGDAGVATLSGPMAIKNIPETGIVQQNFTTKFTPASFQNIPPAEKDQLLAEVLRIITTQGDTSKVKPTNAHLKTLLAKTTQKFNVGKVAYEGETVDGIANGKGKITREDGSVFEGNFSNGYEHGEGINKSKNGTTWQGKNIFRGLVNGLLTSSGPQGNTFLNVKQGAQDGPQAAIDANKVNYSHFTNGKQDGLDITYHKKENKVEVKDFKTSPPTSKVYVPDPTFKGTAPKPPTGITGGPAQQLPQQQAPAPGAAGNPQPAPAQKPAPAPGQPGAPAQGQPPGPQGR